MNKIDDDREGDSEDSEEILDVITPTVKNIDPPKQGMFGRMKSYFGYT